jgi:hypothetical protein
VRKADDFFSNRRGPIHFGVTEKFLRCMHACLRAPCMRCSYHSGHRACMRMTSIASRTYLCDPTTVVSQRDCSSSSGTLAVRRVDDSLWNRRGQIRSDITEKFGSACMHACTMHALLVPFCQACVQAPRMRVHACARTILSCCWRMQGARTSHSLPQPPQWVRFTDVPRTISGAHVCMHLACTGIRTYHSALHAPNTPRARRSTASA